MRILVSVLCASTIATLAVAQVPALYTVSPNNGFLRRVDPASGATLDSKQLVLTNGTLVQQGHSLAVDPTTNLLYAIAYLTSPTLLVRVDPATGVCTSIGNTGVKIAGLAFTSNGQLYAVSGDGNNPAETLYRLNKATGQPTLVMALGKGGQGEAIEFDPVTGLLLHASGLNPANDPVSGLILETVDPIAKTTSPITLAVSSAAGLTALSRHDSQSFWSADFNGSLLLVSRTGVVTPIGVLDHNVKGIAWVDGPSYFASYGAGCPGSGGVLPVLVGSGVPNPARSVSLTIDDALGGATALLTFGLGSGTLNLTPGCALQNAPLLTGLSVPLVLPGAGAGAGSLTLPGTIPPSATTADIYLQALIADPAVGVASSAPLRMHVQ